MTTSIPRACIEDLQEVLRRTARLDADSATFGSSVDGVDVTIPLVRGDRALPTAVVGATGSGKTVLLESLMAGARQAGIEADLADPLQQSDRQILADYLNLIDARNHDLAHRGAISGVDVLPLRILLVDHVADMTAESVDMVTSIAGTAAKVNVVVVVVCQELSGSLLHAHLSTGNRIELRTVNNGIPAHFADGSPTCGVGYAGKGLFRAWWPGN